MSLRLKQHEFDNVIGVLDNILSKMVLWSKNRHIESENKQTLKHHAEDMILAGRKILKELGYPEPEVK